MTFAVNVDPHNSPDGGWSYGWGRPDPAQLYQEKFRGVRFTSRNDDRTRSYVDACKALTEPLRILAIITGESSGYLVPGADVYQIGNEPDVGSTYMSADDYYWNWWKIYRETYPGVRMYMAGLLNVPDAVNYAGRVLELCDANGTPRPDALSIHLYPNLCCPTSSDAANYFDQLWNAFQMPVITTEWYQTAASNDMWNYICMLNDPATGRSTEWNSFFCYSDAMHSGHGLRRTDETPKDEYYSLLSAPCIP